MPGNKSHDLEKTLQYLRVDYSRRLHPWASSHAYFPRMTLAEIGFLQHILFSGIFFILLGYRSNKNVSKSEHPS